MARNKFYAVRQGRHVGVYKTWDECEREVKNYKGAIYKSFSNYDDAIMFVRGESKTDELDSDKKVVAYVDGSFNSITKEFSYGVVAFYKGDKMCFSEKFDDANLASMRNVAGEIYGAERIMRYCVQNNIQELDIYYDYVGIKNWALGAWKTNRAGTIAYKNFYNSIKENVRVKFIKVKAHSNNKYNDEADRLAKEAVGIIDK